MRRSRCTLRVERTDGVTIIRVGGPALDGVSARTFREDIRGVLETSGPRVVLELSGLRSVQCAGLGVLLECFRDVHEREGELRLCSPTGPVQALFELVRVHHLVNVHDSLDSALADWRAPGPRSGRQS